MSELEEATIADLKRLMESGQLSARELTEWYVERIQRLDSSGPRLRSVLEVAPDALEVADSLDRERRERGTRGPLHGIPVLLKDNIDTADGLHTSAGSLALAGSIAREDAFVTRRLREAGAVILGKANMSEWANFRSSNASSGWSSRGGQGRNPYALDRSPCGSSSGSGSAVAANLAVAALGTETDGSIVCPSAANCLVGIKPTVGLTSRSGVIPIAHSQDTVGPMARTAEDAALVLGTIAGADPCDPATAEGAGRSHSDYTRFLDQEGLRGARIGVMREGYFGHSEKVEAVIEGALEVMRRLGAEVTDPVDLPSQKEIAAESCELEVMLYEFKADLNAYLGGLGRSAEVHSLEELIEFDERHADRVMPFFGQDLLIRAQAKGPLTEKGYRDALERSRMLSRERGIDAAMNEHQLDALVAPTADLPIKIDLITGGTGSGGCSQPAAMAGYPMITVPAGFVSGLPVGIAFTGRAYSEPVLIRLAYAFEQATQVRRPPTFPPTVDPEL